MASLLASAPSASFSPSSSSSSSLPKCSGQSKPLVLQSVRPRPQLSKPFPGLRLSYNNFSPLRFPDFRQCKSSKLRFATPESASTVSNNYEGGEETRGREADKKDISDLRDVMGVYREAVLSGDFKTVSEIEARIWAMEKDKNDLQQRVLVLSEEINSGKERYIRLQADFENFRKRSEKERLTTRSDAQGEVIESLLPMVDNFERAKQQLKPETDKEKKIDISYQGIYKQLVEILRSLQVAVVPTVGKPFDPLVHEAIAREESQEFKEGVIVQEFCRGFLLGDRLLRPAMVKVSAGPGSRVTPRVSEKSGGEAAAAAGVDEQ